jgi:hypothetical protein
LKKIDPGIFKAYDVGGIYSISHHLSNLFDFFPELLFIVYYAAFFWIDTFGLRSLARNLEERQVLGWGLTLVLLLIALLVGVALVAPAFLGGFRKGGSVLQGFRAFPAFLGTYMVLGCLVWVIREHSLIFYPGLRPRGWLGYLLIPVAGAVGFDLAAYLGTAWGRRRRRVRVSGLRAHHRTRAVG